MRILGKLTNYIKIMDLLAEGLAGFFIIWKSWNWEQEKGNNKCKKSKK